MHELPEHESKRVDVRLTAIPLQIIDQLRADGAQRSERTLKVFGMAGMGLYVRRFKGRYLGGDVAPGPIMAGGSLRARIGRIRKPKIGEHRVPKRMARTRPQEHIGTLHARREREREREYDLVECRNGG